MNPNRRDFVAQLGAVAASASTLCAAPSNERARPRRPNILCIMSDQHSKHFLGCYGNQILRTPNLDRLAAEGNEVHSGLLSRSGLLTVSDEFFDEPSPAVESSLVQPINTRIGDSDVGTRANGCRVRNEPDRSDAFSRAGPAAWVSEPTDG